MKRIVAAVLLVFAVFVALSASGTVQAWGPRPHFPPISPTPGHCGGAPECNPF